MLCPTSAVIDNNIMLMQLLWTVFQADLVVRGPVADRGHIPPCCLVICQIAIAAGTPVNGPSIQATAGTQAIAGVQEQQQNTVVSRQMSGCMMALTQGGTRGARQCSSAAAHCLEGQAGGKLQAVQC